MNIRDTSTNNWQKNPYWQYAEVMFQLWPFFNIRVTSLGIGILSLVIGILSLVIGILSLVIGILSLVIGVSFIYKVI